MTRKLSYILLFLFFFSGIMAQEPQTEALNPELLNYYQQLNTGKLDNQYGYIPPSVQPKFAPAKTKKSKELPETYDLREFNWVTSIKDQLRCGSCWNFTVLAALESNWLKNGMGEFDLSEQNMRTCQKFNLPGSGTCNAGNELVASGYLFSRLGPVSEDDDPYNGRADAVCVEGLDRVAYVPEAIYLPNEAESSTALREIIKQAILDYGGVFTSMYMDEDLLEGDSIYYSFLAGEVVNHAVLLVGWNDTVKISNKTGAWIAKNSWGDSWGRNGYFYLSFKDKYALSNNAVFPTRVNASHYDTVYMYDEVGWTSNIGYSTEEDTVDTAYGLVKFTTSRKQKITEIGTYVNTSNTELEIEVYLEKDQYTLHHKVAEIKDITCEYPGHYIFSLEDTLSLFANTDFYVKVKYYTPGHKYPIPFESYTANPESGYVYADPTIESGVCWLSKTGEFWFPQGSDQDNKIDLTIKAYAIADTTFSTTETKTTVAPNPAKNMISVEVANISAEDIIVELINSRGIIVFKDIFQNYTDYFSYRYDISKLDAGIYFLRITNGAYTEQQKLIIAR